VAGCLGIIIFLNKNAKTIMDKVATVLAAVILVTVLVVAIISKPPVGDVAAGLVAFDKFPTMFVVLTTLLGGSCGGYIPFSGAHRLVDAGVEGAGNFRKSVTQGVLTSGTVRILLFLAVLGTCGMAAGNADQIINAGNPAAEAFKLAAGNIGYRLFGLCLFSAGISSVVGAAFTSVSFLKTLHPFIAKNEKWFVVGFIAFSTGMMVILGGAATLLIIAGAVNGLILPISLGTMLAASKNKKIVGDYKHPTWLFVLGLVVVAISAYVGIKALPGILKLFA
jgi:Mn2+/Fe2+ NRAMP family transporter